MAHPGRGSQCPRQRPSAANRRALKSFWRAPRRWFRCSANGLRGPSSCAACPTKRSPTCIRAASSACCSRPASEAASCRIARLFELTAVIGQGCGSTAWVLANLAAHHWLLGMWHPEAQEEIWGHSPDSLISSALIFARGRARRVAGRLSAHRPLAVFERDRPLDLEHVRRRRQRRGDRAERTAHVPGAGQRLLDHRHLAGDRPRRHRQQGCRGRRCVCSGLSHPRHRADQRRPQSRQRGQPWDIVQAAGDQSVRLCHRRRFAWHRARRDPAFRRDDPHPP